MKPLFILIFLGPAFSFAVDSSGFDTNQVFIERKDFKELHFPADLVKTNTRQVRASVTDPFEWAGRIYYDSIQGKYPCSGGVVALPGYRPTDKVLVLTAGHCLRPDGGYLLPRKVLFNQPAPAFSFFFEFPRSRLVSGKKMTRVYFKQIIFASFDVVDLALLEMDLTYEDLDYRGQQPPILGAWEFQAKEPITSFGLPADENYQSSRYHLSNCETVELYSSDGGFGNVSALTAVDYTTRDQVANTCTVFPGMSGGYIRDQGGHVIGVNTAKGRDSYALFASVKPILNCATDGRLDFVCLNQLRKSVENTDAVEVKP